MAQIVRPCPDCDGDRPFEQLHDRPGECRDSPGGECPEWSCTACGAALLIGMIPAGYDPASYEPASAARPAAARPAAAEHAAAALCARVA